MWRNDEDEENDRFFRVCLFIVLFWLSLLAMLMFGGCKSIKVEGGTHKSDSVRIEHRIDSVVINTTDSVVVQLPCSDSISVAYVDRWHTKTITKVKELHDTIATASVDSIPYPVEVEVVKVENSKFAGFAIWFFWIVVALITGAVCFVIFRRFILHV